MRIDPPFWRYLVCWAEAFEIRILLFFLRHSTFFIRHLPALAFDRNQRTCALFPPGFWRVRRDRFAFGLFPIRLEIKHHEHADDDEKRTDPFQEPAGIAQNLDAALFEILWVPGGL